MDLVKADIVDFRVAKANANNPGDFELKMNVFGSSTDGTPPLGDTSPQGGDGALGMSDDFQMYGE
jgi:hypothetical protein